MGSRQRPSRLLRNRAVRTPLVAILALVLIGSGTVILRSVTAGADGCSNSGIRLTVAADPAIAPAVAEIGTRWTATQPTVDGECVRVEVTPTPSNQVAEGLATYSGGWVDVAAKPAPTPSESDLPAVWIPDSTYWLGRVHSADLHMFADGATSIAASPVVLAVPEAAARVLAAELTNGLNAALIRQLAADPTGQNKLKLAMIEPRRDTAGMIGAMMLSDAIVASEADLPYLVFAYRSVGAQVNDIDALWKTFEQGITGAPVSEQALLAYNASGAASPMAAVPLADAPTLDFPYAIRSQQSRELIAAAEAFKNVLRSGEYSTLFAGHRLRAPDGVAATGFPTGHGVTAAAVHVQPLSDMAKVGSAMRVWVAARTPSRVVAMADATSSMGSLLGSERTRMQVMQDAAIEGLKLFTDDSEVGLYGYAGPGHQEMVPLAPLNAAQREQLVARMRAARPQPTDVTPLYQTILAGYQMLLTGYKTELSNTLVIFTDGSDSTGKQLRAVQRELEVLADVTRPIRVVLLGIGPNARMADLEAIAQTTGGVAFQVSTPAQMQAIFLRALLA